MPGIIYTDPGLGLTESIWYGLLYSGTFYLIGDSTNLGVST